MLHVIISLVMNTYEAMIIFKPELKDDEIKKNIKDIKEKLSSFGGKILKEDNWGTKNFAYEMNKKTKGYYYISTFELDSLKVTDLTTWLNLQSEGVLRSMITVVNK
ncbi:30S ribosomal protein S6 [candidate division WWE3 bacterium CG_4_9_14_0_2_um_filter_35_11]|uniref:Small ribosomal subunit protein bS6 n=1 Tax=candidate division WWE3 bacterium CG_4_9_14_0_2_um_filter_35_11 TaxID=1975077 RepID=A0A2M8EM63_UNCKA|nr:MAG: 30S ribosomal protein S6 [candidate division WWE3 bacterium CG_4_9_14_0_2_um_filter_35_11]